MSENSVTAPKRRPCDLHIVLSRMVSRKASDACARPQHPIHIQVDIERAALGNLPLACVELPDAVVIPPARVMEPELHIRVMLAALDLAAIDQVPAA